MSKFTTLTLLLVSPGFSQLQDWDGFSSSQIFPEYGYIEGPKIHAEDRLDELVATLKYSVWLDEQSIFRSFYLEMHNGHRITQDYLEFYMVHKKKSKFYI